jgi:NADH-quinone oxidoreductase subunit J
MTSLGSPLQWILGILLILFSLGVILARKPVHSCLSFLVTLLILAAMYLQLSAQFIAVMQVLVYAGAILVIFMFVIVLFQDAYKEITRIPAESSPYLLVISAVLFSVAFGFLAWRLIGLPPLKENLPEDYGTVQGLGHALYVDYFFPFEAVILLFLVAVIGALYIGKKESQL